MHDGGEYVWWLRRKAVLIHFRHFAESMLAAQGLK